MTLLDDDIDDLLQAFRADEAHIDHAIRARIWARVCDAAPEAPGQLDTLDRGARVRRLRPRAGVRPRVLAVAAAVLVLLTVGGLSLRSGPDDDAVTAGPAPTAPLPRDLQELADHVTDLPTTVLGDPGATYVYRQAVMSVRGSPDSETTTQRVQEWVGLDGSGRQRAVGGGSPGDELLGPDSLTLGWFTPAVAIELRDDVDDVVAAVEQAPASAGTFDRDDSAGLVETLTYAGIPGPARAGVLRALDRLGFVPVPAPELGPNLLRVEGPGPDGLMMQADLDLRTGRVIARTRPLAGGGVDRLTDIEADLRRDTEGS